MISKRRKHAYHNSTSPELRLSGPTQAKLQLVISVDFCYNCHPHAWRTVCDVICVKQPHLLKASGTSACY